MWIEKRMCGYDEGCVDGRKDVWIKRRMFGWEERRIKIRKM